MRLYRPFTSLESIFDRQRSEGLAQASGGRMGSYMELGSDHARSKTLDQKWMALAVATKKYPISSPKG